MMVYRPILWRQSECFQDITSSQEIHITYSGNAKGRFTDAPKAAEEMCQKSAQYTNLCKQIPEFPPPPLELFKLLMEEVLFTRFFQKCTLNSIKFSVPAWIAS